MAEADSERLVPLLKALANPVRLELLSCLREPRPLSSLQLRPARLEGGKPTQRPMSRVTVRAHIEQLLELGLIEVRRRVRDGRVVDHFQVNAAQLFEVTEELRRLGTFAPDPGETVLAEDIADEPPAASGLPQLLLVHGMNQGAAWTLPEEGGWGGDIGRRQDAWLSLAYDRYASLTHCRIERRGEAYCLVDAPSNRNGTLLNQQPVPRSGIVELRHGDLIQVGRSLLLARNL